MRRRHEPNAWRSSLGFPRQRQLPLLQAAAFITPPWSSTASQPLDHSFWHPESAATSTSSSRRLYYTPLGQARRVNRSTILSSTNYQTYNSGRTRRSPTCWQQSATPRLSRSGPGHGTSLGPLRQSSASTTSGALMIPVMSSLTLRQTRVEALRVRPPPSYLRGPQQQGPYGWPQLDLYVERD